MATGRTIGGILAVGTALALGAWALGRPAAADLDAAAWRELEKSYKQLFQPLPLKQCFGDSKKEKADCQQAAEAPGAIEDRQNAREKRGNFREDLRKLRSGRIDCVQKHFAADDPRALENMAKGLALVNATLKQLDKVVDEFQKASDEFKPVELGNGQRQYQYGPSNLGRQEWHKWVLAECDVIKAMVGDEMKVKRAILDGFPAAKGGAVLPWLLKELEKNSNAEVRCGVAQALASFDAPTIVPAYVASYGKEKDGLVRVAVIDGLRQRKASGEKATILAALVDVVWEVRAAAVDAVIEFAYKDAATIDALIEALVKEEGRLRGDLEGVLHDLTGMKFAADGLLWRKWWADHRADYEAGKYQKPGDKVTEGALGGPDLKAPDEQKAKVAFYGIESYSKRIAFVFDRSGSMKEKAGEVPGKGGPVITGGGHGGGGGQDGGPQGDMKIDVAKWELKKAIQALPSDAEFTVIFYSEVVVVWQQTLQVANAANKRDAVKFVEDLPPEGATNIFDALEAAFGIGFGAGQVQDPRYGGGKGADTIYLLSDGAPNRGRIQEPNAILAEIQKMNGLRRIVIHTIGIGKDENRPFMKSLAEQNGGQYVHKD